MPLSVIRTQEPHRFGEKKYSHITVSERTIRFHCELERHWRTALIMHIHIWQTEWLTIEGKIQQSDRHQKGMIQISKDQKRPLASNLIFSS